MKTPTLTEGGELPTLYPQPNEDLGVITSPGNSHPFDGSEADWFALKSACQMRDALQQEAAHHSAQLEKALGRIEELEHGLNNARAFVSMYLPENRERVYAMLFSPAVLHAELSALLHPDSTKKS